MEESMTKNRVVYDRLTKVNGKEYDTEIKDAGKSISIDNFGSFINDVSDLPSNETLEQKFSSSLQNGVSKEDNDFKREEIKKFYNTDFRYKNLKLDDEFNDNFMFLGMNCAYRPNLHVENWKMFHDVDDRPDDINMLRLRLLINNIDAKGCYITDVLKHTVDSNSGHIVDEFFLRDQKLSFNEADSESMNRRRAEKLLAWDTKALENKAKMDLRKKRAEEEGIDKSNYKLNSTEEERVVAEVDKKIQSGELTLEHKNLKQAMKDVEDNKKVYEQSIKILIHELDAIYPKQIVIFGTAKGNAQKNSNTGLVHMVAKSKQFDEYKKDESLGHYHDGSELRKLLENFVSVTHYSSRSQPSLRDVFMNCRNDIKNQLINKDDMVADS